jgi:hypothetical protein
MKALDPHRVTTVTDPAVVEIGVTATDGPAVGALELGTIEEDDGEVVNCTEEGALEFDVGINDAPLVGDLELAVVLDDEGALELLRDGTGDGFRVGANDLVGFTVGMIEVGEVIMDGLKDEPLDVGERVVLNDVDC